MAKQPKKDFAGKIKTANTYDADWVFVKGKTPNDGAWMTKKQAKELREEQKAVAAERAAAAAPVPGPGTTVPVLPTTPATTPTTPATPTPPVPTVPTAGTPPAWWLNTAYSNPDDNQMFANVANMLMPLLSPEDAKTMGNFLATNYKDVFGAYANANFGPIPTDVGEAERKAYLSPQRAQQALRLLDAMKTASGKQDMGTGYEFLKNAVGMITQFAGNGPMTREQFDQFSQAVAQFAATASGDQKAYANLAQMFNLPSFTAGPLVNNAPNKKLFS